MSDSQVVTGGTNDAPPVDLRASNLFEGIPKPRGSHTEPAEPVPVLARIPDVGASPQVPKREDRSDNGHGRILSPSLSGKILVGGAILLLLAAIMPFVFGGKDGHQSSSTDERAQSWREDPAPPAPLTPTWEAKTTQTLEPEAVQAASFQQTGDAVGGAVPDSPAAERPPEIAPPKIALPNLAGDLPAAMQDPHPMAPDQQSPPPPVLAETSPVPTSYADTHQPPFDYSQSNRPMAVTGPSQPPVIDYSRGQHPDQQAPNTPAAIAEGRSVAPPGYQPDYPSTDPNRYRAGYARGDYRHDPNARQAPYPVTPQSNDPATGYRTEPQGTGQTGPWNYPRTDAQGGYYPARPPVQVADRRQTATPRYPTTSPTRTEQPGVARFKGIIEKPTVRTGHDGAGSSIY